MLFARAVDRLERAAMVRAAIAARAAQASAEDWRGWLRDMEG